jgi:hypothetical protein
MARGDKTIYMDNIMNECIGNIMKDLSKHIRIVEVRQNSCEEENLLLLTTLTDYKIIQVLEPLLEEERNSEDGEVIYANDDMASKLSEAYPLDIVILYSEPDYLQI